MCPQPELVSDQRREVRRVLREEELDHWVMTDDRVGGHDRQPSCQGLKRVGTYSMNQCKRMDDMKL